MDTIILIIEGMHCLSCKSRIEKKVSSLPGVQTAEVSLTQNTLTITFDTGKVLQCDIQEAIHSLGYSIRRTDSAGSFAGMLFIFFAILILAEFTGSFDMNKALGSNVTYFMLFTIGLVTSLHCMGMCGGIMLSQTVTPNAGSGGEALVPSLLYSLGRIISYTALGALVGALGSVVSLSPAAMGAVTLFAGAVMILMGLNLAGFGFVRKYLQWPGLPINFKRPKTPLAVGLLNGLMPCGPLQTMQLYALTTGSAVAGASAMFMFSLGTAPLMLIFGSLAGFMSRRLSSNILRCSGILVIVLGLIMTNRGLALSGIDFAVPGFNRLSSTAASPAAKAEISNGIQTIRMSANSKGYVPNVLYIQKGVPVKWIITGEQINSCNNEIIVPTQNIRKKLSSSETVIEFTPGNEDLNFSCWMGMIRGIFKVVDDLSRVDVARSNVSLPSSSGCGGNCCSTPAGQQSIYGPDLTKAPTQQLIKTTKSAGSFKGIGYELAPLVIVSEKPGSLEIDLSQYDQPEGVWEIVDFSQRSVIKTFEGAKRLIKVTFPANSPGSYGIFQDQKIKGLVDYRENVDSVNLEEVRKKYF